MVKNIVVSIKPKICLDAEVVFLLCMFVLKTQHFHMKSHFYNCDEQDKTRVNFSSAAAVSWSVQTQQVRNEQIWTGMALPSTRAPLLVDIDKIQEP